MFSWRMVCDIASLMLPNIIWAKGLIELCFSCFTASDWLGLREAAVARDNSIVMLDKPTSIGKTQLLVNAGIERLPVTTAVVMNLLTTVFRTAAKRFIFLGIFSPLAISLKNRPLLCLFSLVDNYMDLALVVMER